MKLGNYLTVILAALLLIGCGDSSEPKNRIKPVITIHGANPISIALGSTYIDAGASAVDDVDGNVSVSTLGVVDTNTSGSYTIVYTARDSANNSETARRTVFVVDSEIPLISLYGKNPVSIVRGLAYNDAGAIAVDLEDGNVSVITTSDLNLSVVGAYTVTYTARDSHGNVARETRTVHVTESEAPVVTLIGPNPVSLAIGVEYFEFGALATHNTEGNLSVTVNSEVDSNTSGTYYVSYSAKNNFDNETVVTRVVNIIDTDAPVITLYGENPLLMELTEDYTDAGAFATDTQDGNISVVFDDNISLMSFGNVYITFVATDSDGNQTTERRRIIVSNQDPDHDGLDLRDDNCDEIYNPNQYNTDGDFYGDACDDDIDNDGRKNDSDAFPYDASEWSDSDGDGIGNNTETDDDNDNILDGVDNCPSTPNTNQIDTDGDEEGDVCDEDIDNDGKPNTRDDFPYDPTESWDIDGDGIGNNTDLDDDGDGVLDDNDLFPFDVNDWLDFDDDKIGDNADLDDDNDGMPDLYEVANGLNPRIFDANEDLDGDWVRNHDEYREDTNASDPSSYKPFHLLSWTQELGAEETHENAYKVTYDSVGDIYIVGSTYGTFGEENFGKYDGFVSKYTRDGVKLWTKQIGTSETDSLKDIVIDNSDNIYIIGDTYDAFIDMNNSGSSDIFVSKLNKEGDILWTKQWGTQERDLATSLTCDNDGNVYTLGNTDGSFEEQDNEGYGSDLFLTKLAPSGNIIWVKQWYKSSYYVASDIAIDKGKNLYVSGYRMIYYGNGLPLGDRDVFLIKFNTNGEELLEKVWRIDDADEISSVIKTDSNGSLYMAGYLNKPESSNYDVFVAKLDSNGSDIWVQEWGAKSTYEYISDLSLGNDGSIYVTGYANASYESNEAIGDNDIIISRLDANGSLGWSKQFGSTQNDEALGITVDTNESIYVVGDLGSKVFLSKFSLVENIADIDSDSILNRMDNCPRVANNNQNDRDGDSVGDLCDSDIDDDNVSNELDAFPYNSAEWLDTDKDGLGNNVDTDDDNDSIPDSYETLNGLNPLEDDAFMDDDYDGAYNYGEYIEGTDPQDAENVPVEHKFDFNQNWRATELNSDEARDVAIDSESNIYVVGRTVGVLNERPSSPQLADAYLMKFDANGSELWVVQIESELTTDRGYSVSIDESDNIFVTGKMGTAAFVTKYDSDGNRSWIKLWNVDVDSEINVISQTLSTDTNGSVYISGYYLADEQRMFLRKLNESGELVWHKQWENQIGEISDVFIDASTNIYITGRIKDSFDNTTSLGGADIFVMRLSSQGDIVWTRQWGTSILDRGEKLGMDSLGSLYLTGGEAGLNALYKFNAQGDVLLHKTWSIADESESGEDIVIDAQGYIYVLSDLDSFVAITKFNANGDRISILKWLEGYRTQHAYDFAMDTDGTLYLAGVVAEERGSGILSSTLRKYILFVDEDRDGVLDTRDNCPTVSNSEQNDMNGDNIGDACDGDIDGDQVGNGVDAFPYDPNETADKDGDGIGNNADTDDDNDGMPDTYEIANGLSQFTNDANVDRDGDGVNNLQEYIEGTNPQDTNSFSMPYELQWTQQWGTVAEIGQPATNELASSIARDRSSNLYITGKTNGASDGNSNSGDYDIFLSKYDSRGNQLWVKQWGSTNSDESSGIAIDSNGSIYVTGSTAGSLDGNSYTGGYDAFLSKFDENGTKLWTQQWGTDGSEVPEAIAINSSGTVYVTGYTDKGLDGNINSGFYDVFFTMFDGDEKSGTIQWGTSAGDVSKGIAIDGDNNVYVTGYTYGIFENQSRSGKGDIFVSKFDMLNRLLWTKQWGTDEADIAYSIITDTLGNSYTTGRIGHSLDENNSVRSKDIFLSKLDSNGTEVWRQEWGTNDFDVGNGVVIDSYNNLYVTGYTEGELDGNTNYGDNDAFLSKFYSNGHKAWTKQWGSSISASGSGIPNDSAEGITIDAGNSIYIIGDTSGDLEGNLNTGSFDVFLSKLVAHSDNDGIDNTTDNCPSVANFNQTDTDGDGVGDACDSD